eukprot:gene16844-8451_t
MPPVAKSPFAPAAAARDAGAPGGAAVTPQSDAVTLHVYTVLGNPYLRRLHWVTWGTGWGGVFHSGIE